MLNQCKCELAGSLVGSATAGVDCDAHDTNQCLENSCIASDTVFRFCATVDDSSGGRCNETDSGED